MQTQGLPSLCCLWSITDTIHQLFYTEGHPMCGLEEDFPSSDNQSKLKRSCENAEHVGKFLFTVPGCLQSLYHQVFLLLLLVSNTALISAAVSPSGTVALLWRFVSVTLSAVPMVAAVTVVVRSDLMAMIAQLMRLMDPMVAGQIIVSYYNTASETLS